MGETRWLDDDEQRTWRSFLATSQMLDTCLDRQLQRDAGMPHAYYMILVALSEAAERTMTLTELAVVTRSSASRLSHAMNRLEAQGWVTRCRHPADGRTTLARLTDTGFDALADAAPGHVSEVRRVLFDPLSPEQVHQLRSICQTILNGLGSAPPAR